MAELLIELFSEEIPARMQVKAEADLLAALRERLGQAGLGWQDCFAVSGPRRLAAVFRGLDMRSPDLAEERKGPKTSAPEQAIAGFLRATGLADISQARIVEDARKGDYYVADLVTPGREAREVIAEVVPAIIRDFHWPKSMRSGEGDLRWVRPLRRIMCILEGEVVAFEVGGIASSDVTEGHRVHGRGPFRIAGWEDYRFRLEGEGHVILSRQDREKIIRDGIARVCSEAGLEPIDDPGLVEEVIGLAEWPVVILGKMDPSFLDLPAEVITLSMRTHQKYFATRHAGSGALAPFFIVVANLQARDQGAQIAAGNARVLSARLSDARFFWEKDRSVPLEDMARRLDHIAFRDGLGSLGEKVGRVERLAGLLAGVTGADPALTARAARLCKADLVSEMVGEFPELQGVMGRYYALAGGEPAEVADAIRDHYRPQGQGDLAPSAPVSVALGLADRIDTLVGFWAIDEKPTGSKDPFALRRAALSVVRLVLENSVRLPIRQAVIAALNAYAAQPGAWPAPDSLAQDLLGFFADRLKQVLRDQGRGHDFIDAVFALGDDDLVRVVRRVGALADFLETEDGANLLAGYRRAVNILKAEEKKGALPAEAGPDPELISAGPQAERDLAEAVASALSALASPLDREDFAEAMKVLARLRSPVDAFFDNVMVNDPDTRVRGNRLALLMEIRRALHQVADFSRISG